MLQFYHPNAFLTVFVLLTAAVCSFAAKMVSTLMQRDEGVQLRYWIDYHASIFRPNDIIILDNLSDDELTKSVLDYALSLHLKVFRNETGVTSKGRIELSRVRKYCPGGELYFPLDCDEFIVAIGPNGEPVANRTLIVSRMQDFWERRKDTVTCWGFNTVYDLYPDTTDYWNSTRYRRNNVSESFSKKAYHLDDLTYLDPGHHLGVAGKNLRTGRCELARGLGLLHFHHRGGSLTAKKALVLLQGLQQLPKHLTMDNLAAHRNIVDDLVKARKPGNHKAKELLLFIDKGPAAFVFQTKHRKDTFDFLSLDQLTKSMVQQRQ